MNTEEISCDSSEMEMEGILYGLLQHKHIAFCLFNQIKSIFILHFLLLTHLFMVKCSRLANSDIKNAIYPLVFLYKGK